MANKRYGKFQGFIRGVSKDDGRYDGAQLGVVTYDADDNYLVSYVEAGVRCDHIGDRIASDGRLTASSEPLDCDADLMVPRPAVESSSTTDRVSELEAQLAVTV